MALESSSSGRSGSGPLGRGAASFAGWSLREIDRPREALGDFDAFAQARARGTPARIPTALPRSMIWAATTKHWRPTSRAVARWPGGTGTGQEPGPDPVGTGDLEEGLRGRACGSMPQGQSLADHPQPRWDGGPLGNAVDTADAGAVFGDAIHRHCRYAPLVKARRRHGGTRMPANRCGGSRAARASRRW